MEMKCQELYEGRTTVALLPSELWAIRKYLLSTGLVTHLMLWCLISLSVKLFLRISEVLELRISHFQEQYCVIRKKEVIAICLKIKGKSNTTEQYFIVIDDKVCPELNPLRPLLIYIDATGRQGVYGKSDTTEQYFIVIDDKVCPELNPLRPLLIYIDATGRQGVYLFPTLSQLYNKYPTEHYKYGCVLEDCKYLCHDILKKDIKTAKGTILIIGTHIFRKTAFLIAYWGKRTKLQVLDVHFGSTSVPLLPEDISSILLDGRHSSVLMTATYLADAAPLFALKHRLGEPNSINKVAPYQPVFLRDPSSIAAIYKEGNVRIVDNTKTIPQIANWFVTTVLCKASTTPTQDCISKLCQDALTLYAEPDTTTELLNGIKERVSAPMLYNGLCEVLDTLNLATINNTVTNTNNHQPPTQMASPQITRTGIQNLPPQVTPPRAPAPVRPEENFFQLNTDYQSLCNARHLSPADKIPIILEACNEIRNLWTPQTKCPPKLYTWVYKVGRIEHCVKTCYKGNIQRFIFHNPKFTQNYKGGTGCTHGGKHYFVRNF